MLLPVEELRVAYKSVFHRPRRIILLEYCMVASPNDARAEDTVNVDRVPSSIWLPYTEVGRYGARAVYVDAENLLRARVEEDLFFRAISTGSVQNGFDAVFRNPIEDVRIVGHAFSATSNYILS